MVTSHMTKDPVRGTDVDEATATLKADHAGSTFYFCGASCKDKFVKDPAKYPAGAVKSTTGCCGGCH